MTRFWLTLDQGVAFVIRSLMRMKGGEVFVPKIPSMKVTDLADVIAPGAKKRIIGIRPGEKLHEILLTEEESLHAFEFEDYFIIESEHPYWGRREFDGGRKLAEGYRYTSDTNTRWLTKDELQTCIDIS
jgi:UDP-N-acetylglucosamine 4,6-dehydratase